MPIAKVQLPDGRIGRFEVPEGTTPEQVIEFAGKQNYDAPQESSAIPSPPIAGAGPGGSDLQWNQPGYPQAAPPDQSYQGTILPFSRDAEGNTSFDSDAGFLGPIKRTVMLPGQVIKGEVNPTSPEGLSRSLEAALMMTPMSPASRGGMMSKGAFKTPEKKVPSRAALKEATDEGYTRARAMGAEYTPKSVTKWADDMTRALDEAGRIEPNYPKVHALLKKLKTAPDDAVSVRLEAIDAAYRELGKLAGDQAEGSAAAFVQKSLDDFHSSLGPESLVAGTASPQAAAAALRDARGNAAAGFRSDRVTGLEKTQARRTASANSGRNADNNIRQRLTSLIESQKGSRGLTEAEEAAIDDIIFGRTSKNAARYVGNLLGGGGGLGSTLLGVTGAAGGAYAMGPAGAALGLIPPTIGGIARSTANRMSKKELGQLDELIRSRSPLYKNAPQPAPVYQPGGARIATGAAGRASLAEQLMQQQQRGPNGGTMINGVEYF